MCKIVLWWIIPADDVFTVKGDEWCVYVCDVMNGLFWHISPQFYCYFECNVSHPPTWKLKLTFLSPSFEIKRCNELSRLWPCFHSHAVLVGDDSSNQWNSSLWLCPWQEVIFLTLSHGRPFLVQVAVFNCCFYVGSVFHMFIYFVGSGE